MSFLRSSKSLEKNHDKVSVRMLKDMSKAYKNAFNCENSEIYRVYIKHFVPLEIALTVVNSGNVNGEYYMTLGHVHQNKTPEFYVLLEGSGILYLQKGSNSKKIVLKKNKIEYIPEGFAHRLINNGNVKLKVVSVYHFESKPNYSVVWKRRFFKNEKLF